MWHGNPKLRYEIDLDDNIDVIITSYGVLRRDAEMLSERQFRLSSWTRSQSAKNAASQNATAVRQLKSERRLALTGTPIENRPEELWTTFDFLAPGFLKLRQLGNNTQGLFRGDGQALEMLATRAAAYPATSQVRGGEELPEGRNCHPLRGSTKTSAHSTTTWPGRL